MGTMPVTNGGDSPQVSDGKWSVSYSDEGSSLVQIQHCVLFIKDLRGQKWQRLITSLHIRCMSASPVLECTVKHNKSENAKPLMPTAHKLGLELQIVEL